MSLDNYTKQLRGYEYVWLHKSRPVWLVEYPKTVDRAKFYQAYKADQPVKTGAFPWSLNNRRVGSDRGFPTLEEAAQAGDEA